MLAELRVRGLAVIADARLEPGGGLNVLTGETGAGKSLLVDALSLLLGERADADLVRASEQRCVVDGVFEVEAGREGSAGRLLERLGIEPENGRLVLKREVHRAGRSRAWINGSPVTVAVLAEVGACLVDLHGQHETQSLLRVTAQRDMLDAFAGAAAAAQAVAEAFEERERIARERRELESRQAEVRRRADYLLHVAREIAAANPRPGELEELEAEVRRLGHAEELGRTARELAGALDDEEHSAAGSLGHAARLLSALERIDPRGSAGWREMLEAALANTEELCRAVRDYADGLDLDPARLGALEQRRDLLSGLDRKYGPGLERVLDAGDAARRDLALLSTSESDLRELVRACEAADRAFRERCRALSTLRRKGARRLASEVSRHLGALGMEGGRLSVALEAQGEPGRHGAERVEFLCALNPGLPERPVAKAASGGELSRLMLALKLELARHDDIGTLVFDEVDSGIGGLVANRVAEALASVASGRQVLVITHLPQIAALADTHQVVSKRTVEGAAEATVSAVEGAERVEELARMLGGAGKVARRHAAELLQGAR
jgi:DNA repair protein RecN (Recombination protein N)